VPSLQFEQNAIKATSTILIAGLDEAGRGALAGPVVAAAVILPLDLPGIEALLWGVDDSKQLTAVTREKLFHTITNHVLSYAIGSCSAFVIDKIGIIPATKQAMTMAIAQLDPTPDYLLIDGRIRLTNIPTPQQAIVRGDRQSLSIAAASILAKVTRDRLMLEMDKAYPQYGFAQHKGYGTEKHRAAIEQFGPCAIHRYSFSPIRKPLL
jgi:ribonuclease HII